MGYRNIQECVSDLERSHQLRRINVEVDPDQEIGIIQRRVYAAGGPALLFSHPKGCRFPMLGNLFGTLKRTRYIFRDTLEQVRLLVETKRDPRSLARNPGNLLRVPLAARLLLPKRVARGPILAQRTSLSSLPQLKSWPLDGGAFVTLPLVYSESPARPGLRHGNLGMYRVQISGGSYAPDREAGLHYQIHRGIGAHHAEALERGESLRVNVFVGGPPSLSVAGVMPLPEGMPELSFAGLLGGRRLELVTAANNLPMPAEADFVISGTIDPRRTLPEGPFGDHLGYYSLEHEFPVLQVDAVHHRADAIWPFTTVGRPPQEDTTFGAFIHELTGPLIPEVLPGVHAVHAVDAAGVHPLLLAIGSERYVPYAEERRPMELLTLANAILGQGQLSLAKYLFIIAREDAPALDIHDIAAFLRHVLERADWRSDLHFHTRTTIDTLDYSGHGFNAGSKVVVAAAGPVRRKLPDTLGGDLALPPGYSEARLVLPGVLAVQGPPHRGERGVEAEDMADFCAFFDDRAPLNQFPLVVVVDDSEFVARTLNNFVWTVFTRSNPATDIHGIGAFNSAKHWGCTGSLVIDARRKGHHPPALEEDPAAVRRVEELAARGGPLHGLF
ncbi:4-hydroxy-3-polyprenylbenzoate decarboxylase [Geoalkalibacter ferrihydriticus]|uniref:3-octaprenyl-4-hydroxybenzoate carboxy-lyase n=2 Tax=Geoalkalibacter ferrihydriticus TaxID=392333 RepID=A0A0C2HSF9_9BACT|nr:UbiD family decarboxylase [Geoalkalibacter ferrihydriticus]KIH75677.1 3-octaprenyl-4-hydroxybenzoate carboxy-lyase [Geoalkalibacter ferrihydriticus DSM 17813]SDM73168.1 4-hydroxy-3-polyprenylbenzoate decarboxylase [Geoalkalibacter ferrihydriticus]